MTLHIQCIGELIATKNGDPIALSPLALTLLAVLEAEKERAVSRAHLIDLIWESNPTPAKRHSLSQLIYEIRTKCGHEVSSNRIGIRLVDSTSDYHDLLAARTWDDVRHASASDLMRGASVDSETFSDWRAAKSARLCRHVIALGHDALQEARSKLLWSRVAQIAGHILQWDTYNEAAWYAKLESLAAEGQVGRALGELASVRFLYKNDLGQPPPQSLQRFGTILTQMQNADAGVHVGTPEIADLPFAGRAEELTAIASLCRRTRIDGSARLVVITGASGIGKTALIDRSVRSELLGGARAIVLQCTERTRMDGYNCVRQLLRKCAPSMLELEPEWKNLATQFAAREVRKQALPGRRVPTQVISELCLKVVRAYAAKAKEVVVVIDDAQWLDRASLGVLTYAIPRLVRRRVVWLIASRPEGITDLAAIVRAWRMVQEAQPVELTVGPISTLDVQDILSRMQPDAEHAESADVANAVQYCAGNPLLLKLWISHRAEALTSPGELGLVQQEVPASARHLADILALLGGKASTAIVREIGNFDEDSFIAAVACLQKLHVVRATDVLLEFTHELVRERVALGISVEHARRIHRRALAVLRNTQRQSVILLAQHALASGDERQGVDFAIQAGEESAAVGAHDEAEFFLRQAATLATGATDKAAAMLALGRYYIQADRVHDAKQCFDEALRLEGVSLTPELKVYVEYLDVRAGLLGLTSDAASLVDRAVQLLKALGSDDHHELLAQVVTTAVEAAHDSGASEVIRHTTEEIERLFDTCSIADRAFLAGLVARICSVYGSLREGRAWADRARVLARESQDELAVLRALVASGTAELAAGYVHRSLACFEEAQDLSRRPKAFHYHQRVLNNYGVALIEADRLAEARSVIHDALAAAGGHDRLFLLGNLAYTELLCGNCDLAVRHARALIGLNATFRAGWADGFSHAVQRSCGLPYEGADEVPAFSTVQLIGAHELVVWDFLHRQASTDLAAARRIASELASEMRGRDMLRRMRYRVYGYRLSGMSSFASARMTRIAAWAKRRGALRLVAEIQATLSA